MTIRRLLVTAQTKPFRQMTGWEKQTLILNTDIQNLREIFKQESQESRLSLVKYVLADWEEDTGPGKLRRQAAKLVSLTLPGDVLSFLHPGVGLAYRGGMQFKGGLVASWSFDKNYASTYGPLTSRKITLTDPALSLDILFNSPMKEFLMSTKK